MHSHLELFNKNILCMVLQWDKVMCRSLDSLLHPYISTLIFHTVFYKWQGEFVGQSRASLVNDNYLILVTMGFQTSLYFCDPIYFLYGQFDFLYGQPFTFYMVNSSFMWSTFYFWLDKFLLFIWLTQLFIWSTFYFLCRSL